MKRGKTKSLYESLKARLYYKSTALLKLRNCNKSVENFENHKVHSTFLLRSKLGNGCQKIKYLYDGNLLHYLHFTIVTLRIRTG